ncbi:hypothetical protein [Streptomyces sp. NPDC096152]|uniref:hypothetical protein n=1 Tax=Streptomyces sp. NPDC096152 TaxID=3366078 RepID=UPI00381CFF59
MPSRHPVPSTMQAVPLLVSRLLENGMKLHGGSEVVTATDTGTRSADYATTAGCAPVTSERSVPTVSSPSPTGSRT